MGLRTPPSRWDKSDTRVVSRCRRRDVERLDRFRQSQQLNIARREYKLQGHGYPTCRQLYYRFVMRPTGHWHRYRAKTPRSVDDAADAASVDRYTVIPVGRRRWAGFTRPNALSDVPLLAHATALGASSTPSSILTTTRAPTRCRRDSTRSGSETRQGNPLQGI